MTGKTVPSARAAAVWMKETIDRDGLLYQDVAATHIASNFGDDLTWINANGNLAIRKSVLDIFNRLTGNDVVWMQRDRYWRKREDYDLPSRRQP